MRNQSKKPLECIENPQFKLGLDFCLGKLKKGEREAKIVCVGLVFRTVGGSGTDDCVSEMPKAQNPSYCPPLQFQCTSGTVLCNI